MGLSKSHLKIACGIEGNFNSYKGKFNSFNAYKGILWKTVCCNVFQQPSDLDTICYHFTDPICYFFIDPVV